MHIVDQLAKICHEVSRAYLSTLSDNHNGKYNWDDAPNEYKARLVDSVVYMLENPKISAQEYHDYSVRIRKEKGWEFGVIYSVSLKEHPLMVPYKNLPDYAKVQIDLSMAIIGCFKIAESPEELEEQTHPAMRPPKMEEEK